MKYCSGDSGSGRAEFIAETLTLAEAQSIDSDSPSQDITIRPFLLSSGVIWRLKIILTLGRAVFMFPWSWGEIQGENGVKNFEVTRWSPTWERVWSFGSLITLFCSSTLTVFQFSLLINIVKDSPASYRLPFKLYTSACWQLHSAMLTGIFLYFKEPMRTYANTLFAFNRRFVGELTNTSTNSKE